MYQAFVKLKLSILLLFKRKCKGLFQKKSAKTNCLRFSNKYINKIIYFY